MFAETLLVNRDKEIAPKKILAVLDAHNIDLIKSDYGSYDLFPNQKLAKAVKILMGDD